MYLDELMATLCDYALLELIHELLILETTGALPPEARLRSVSTGVFGNDTAFSMQLVGMEVFKKYTLGALLNDPEAAEVPGLLQTIEEAYGL